MSEPTKQQILTFADLLIVQEKLQTAMGWPSGGLGLQMAKDNLLHSHSEIDEVLDEIYWKPHKSHQPEYGQLKDRSKFVMELTDVFQTLANVALAYNVTPAELSMALITKWGANFEAVDAGEFKHG